MLRELDLFNFFFHVASIQQKLTRNISLSSHHSLSSIQQQIARQRQLLKELDSQKSQIQHTNAQLADQLEKTQEKIKQRTNDMAMLQTNYQQHLRSVRSSDDDPSTIATKLVDLRRQIHELASELLPHAEPITTTEKLSTLWLNLSPAIDHLGKPLPAPRIQLLTEKFMMDVLVQNLNINIFPGLSCNNEFLELQDWFDQHDTSSFFSTRLRQELSKVVIQQQMEGEVAATWKKCVDCNWYHLYRGLQKAYPTYLAKKDGVSANEQAVAHGYSKKLRGLVEYTVGLGSVIKGQEVCITAVDVREGKQSFDVQLMDDEDGQASGVIAFCISPPFVVKIANRYEPLVKGRVLCFPTTTITSNNEPTTDNIP
jgi:hypothetical protein